MRQLTMVINKQPIQDQIRSNNSHQMYDICHHLSYSCNPTHKTDIHIMAKKPVNESSIAQINFENTIAYQERL